MTDLTSTGWTVEYVSGKGWQTSNLLYGSWTFLSPVWISRWCMGWDQFEQQTSDGVLFKLWLHAECGSLSQDSNYTCNVIVNSQCPSPPVWRWFQSREIISRLQQLATQGGHRVSITESELKRRIYAWPAQRDGRWSSSLAQTLPWNLMQCWNHWNTVWLWFFQARSNSLNNEPCSI